MDFDISEVVTQLGDDLGLAERLGPDWAEQVGPHVADAWCFGYTAAMADSARLDNLLKP